MKRTRTRVLSLLLACTMLFSITPMTALAEDDPSPSVDVVENVPADPVDPPVAPVAGDEDAAPAEGEDSSIPIEEEPTEPEEDKTTPDSVAPVDIPEEDGEDGIMPLDDDATHLMSGNCGATDSEDSVTWALTVNNSDSEKPTYILTIAGTGKMKDFTVKAASGSDSAVDDRPWASYITQITQVIFSEGISVIGSRACSGMSNLESCSIPASVIEIHSNAFSSTGIENLTFAENCRLETIGSGAFWGCESLTGDLNIPDSVESIEAYAFQKAGITSLSFGNSVESIGNYAFCACPSLKGELIIPDSVKTIENGAFNGSPITSVKLGSGLEKIGGNAFYRTTGQAKVSLGTNEFVVTSKMKTVPNSALSGLSFDVLKIEGGSETTFGDFSVAHFGDQIHSIVLLSDTIPVFDDTSFRNTFPKIIYAPSNEIKTALSLTSNNVAYAITNGGTFVPTDTFGDSALTTPTKDNYKFDGWYTSEGFSKDTKVENNAVSKDSNSKYLTYYAKWISIISFDANGGTGTMEAQEIAETDTSTALATNSFSREGYTFSGWNTAADGSGTAYADQATGAGANGAITLYAQWTKKIGETTNYTVNAILDQTYTGDAIEPAVVVKNSSTGDVIASSEYTVSYSNNTNVGTASVTVTKGSDSATVEFKIVKDTNPTVEMADVSVTYGIEYAMAATAKTSAGNEITDGSITIKYYTDADCTTEWTATNNEAQPAAAGTYYAKATLTETENYAEASKTAKLEISNATFSVTAIGYSGTYDGQTHHITVEANGANVTYSTDGTNYTSTNPAFTDTGTYTVYYKAVKDNHEDVTSSVSVEITKATLIATYAGEMIRAGQTPILAVTVTGFVGGETAETAEDYVAPTVSNDNTEVGEYTLTPEGGSAKNYTFTYEAGTLIIRKKSTSGGTSSSSKDYAISVDSAKNGKVTVSPKSADKGDTVTITVKPDKGYVLDELVITDKKGNEIDYKAKGDNKFTFKMPASKVEIEATFAPEKAEECTIVLTLGSTAATVFGTPVLNDVAPIARNNRTMLPIRFIAEALGARVDWDQPTQKVTITRGTLVIEIFLNSDVAYVNGQPVQLDSPAFAENNRTYLPLRFVAENLGATVEWEQATQRVIITVD